MDDLSDLLEDNPRKKDEQKETFSLTGGFNRRRNTSTTPDRVINRNANIDNNSDNNNNDNNNNFSNTNFLGFGSRRNRGSVSPDKLPSSNNNNNNIISFKKNEIPVKKEDEFSYSESNPPAFLDDEPKKTESNKFSNENKIISTENKFSNENKFSTENKNFSNENKNNNNNKSKNVNLFGSIATLGALATTTDEKSRKKIEELENLLKKEKESHEKEIEMYKQIIKEKENEIEYLKKNNENENNFKIKEESLNKEISRLKEEIFSSIEKERNKNEILTKKKN